jgi:crotonobetainyl-CoA:carnitine CoA-transferase CaiB-like acyl-CoA transferase
VRLALAHTLMAMTAAECMRDPVNDTLRVHPLLEDLRRIRERGGTYQEMTVARFDRMLRSGSTNQGMYYRGYQAKDGGFVLGCVTPQNRDSARRVFGITDDNSDSPDFDVYVPENKALLERIGERMREIARMRTVGEWLADCEREGVPAAPVNFAEELADEPQARLYMTEIDHPLAGVQLHVKPAYEFSETPASIAGPAPLLGQHTAEVLRRHGFNEAEIERLRAESIIP